MDKENYSYARKRELQGKVLCLISEIANNERVEFSSGMNETLVLQETRDLVIDYIDGQIEFYKEFYSNHQVDKRCKALLDSVSSSQATKEQVQELDRQ